MIESDAWMLGSWDDGRIWQQEEENVCPPSAFYLLRYSGYDPTLRCSSRRLPNVRRSRPKPLVLLLDYMHPDHAAAIINES